MAADTTPRDRAVAALVEKFKGAYVASGFSPSDPRDYSTLVPRVENGETGLSSLTFGEIVDCLADAGLLVSSHLTHSLCLEWDETCEGFTTISDGAEAGHVVVLLDTVRQVIRERDAARETQGLSHALLLKGVPGLLKQVDAQARLIKQRDAELAELRGQHQAGTPRVCNGGWTVDENYQPEDYEAGEPLRPEKGLIPCGLCNHGGWDAPWPTAETSTRRMREGSADA